MVQPLGPQVQVGAASKLCGLPPKVSLRLRFCNAPPPTFVMTPLIGYVTVLFAMLAVPAEHVFDALIAHVLRLPRMIDFKEAVEGLLPDETLANMTELKQGGGPLKIVLRSIPPSSNCNAGTAPLGNPAKFAPATLNPLPGA